MRPVRLGRYELLRHLASGGMARVYLARVTGPGGFARHVVVKTIPEERVDTQMLREGMPGARPDMSPDDIAKTALFLAHAAPSALTGACIDVYG